jgi:clan AA aspartic protease
MNMERTMYEVHTELTLKNGDDAATARRGHIKETEVRQITVDAVVDTGAWTLVINEETRVKLGLPVLGTDIVNLADGASSPCSHAGAVEVWWKDRWAICSALVLPHASEILLGAIPLEALDLAIDPRAGQVKGAHGDEIIHRLYLAKRAA